MSRWMRALVVGCVVTLLTAPSPAIAWAEGSPTGQAAVVSVARSFPPDMASQVSPTSPLTVEFAGPLTPAFYQTVNFNLLHGTTPVDGDLFYNPAARQVMFKPRQALPQQQTFTVQVSFQDGLGQTRGHTWNFRTDGVAGSVGAAGAAGTTGMRVQNTAAPSSAAMSVPQTSGAGTMIISGSTLASGNIVPEAPLEIQFSEPLDLASLRDAPVRLVSGGQSLGIDYRLSRDMKTLTLVPRQKLTESQDYQVALSSGLSGVGGQQLGKNTLIPFRVSAHGNPEVFVPSHVVDESPPDIAFQQSLPSSAENFSTMPANNRVSAARNPVAGAAVSAPAVTSLHPGQNAEVTNLSQPVTVVFNKELRSETLNEFTFRLEDDFGPVPAKIQYFSGRKQGTLTPIGILDANRTYRIVVTQGVTDTDGKALARGIASSFMVTSAAQPPRPTAVAAPAAATSRSPMAPAQGPATSMMLRSPLQESRDLELLEDDNDDFAFTRGTSATMQTMAGRASSAPNSMTATAGRTTQTGQPRANTAANAKTASSISRSNSGAGNGRMNSSASASMASGAGAGAVAGTQRSQMRQRLTTFKVEGILPGSQATDVSRNTQIFVHFSEQADPKTINNVNISVFGHQDRVEGMVKYDGTQRRAIFTPSRPLDPNTNYKVRISDKVSSAAGETLPAWISWNFSTAEDTPRQYVPKIAAEADAAFFIPLVDSRLPIKPVNRADAAMQNAPAGTAMGSSGPAFTLVSSKHWAFKSLRHVTEKGILKTFPFRFTDNITRYEFANAINNALGSLKAMQSSADRPQLKIADLVELQKLIIEFQPELKSYGVNTAWFEVFLQRQGVKLDEIRRRVQVLNQKHAG